MPAALTKDKKRLRGKEVSVHLAWKSTLYVTNFPEKADDTFMRDLFGKVFYLILRPCIDCVINLGKSSELSSMYVGPARSSRIRGDFVTCSTLHQYVAFTFHDLFIVLIF